MSMHEIEAMVEESVRLLAAAAGRDSLDLRSMFWQLYEFQYTFDASFTEFRVRDILVEQRYFYRFELSQHPDYKRYQDFFDGLPPNYFESIGVDPLRPVGGAHRDRKTQEWIEANPLCGYVQAPYLYCEIGSLLWKRFVELGVLTGRDAQPADPYIRLMDTALAVVGAAEQVNDVEMIAVWHVIMLVPLSMADLDALQKDEAFREFLEIVTRTHAHDLISEDLLPDYYRRPPPPDDPTAYIEQLRQWQIEDGDL